MKVVVVVADADPEEAVAVRKVVVSKQGLLIVIGIG